MKLRGTLGGLNLLLEPGDTEQTVTRSLSPRTELLSTNVTFEVAGDTQAEALEAALMIVRAAGGSLGRLRAPRVSVAVPPPESDEAKDVSDKAEAESESSNAQTVIVPHNVRAGFRGEYKGSVVVLGDVNPGAELIAGGDVIVTGVLRGVVHAGYGGQADAIVWARPIASPQIRIGDSMARSPEGTSNMRTMEGREQTERAYLKDGMIVIDAQR